MAEKVPRAAISRTSRRGCPRTDQILCRFGLADRTQLPADIALTFPEKERRSKFDCTAGTEMSFCASSANSDEAKPPHIPFRNSILGRTPLRTQLESNPEELLQRPGRINLSFILMPSAPP